MSEQNKKDKNKKKTLYYVVAILIILVIIAGLAIWYFTKYSKNDNTEIAYTELIKYIDNGEVEKIEMTSGSSSAKVKLYGEEEEKNTSIPNTQAFVELIQQKTLEGISFEFNQKKQNVLVTISQTLFSLLPTIMLVVLFVVLFKMQGLGDKGKVYDAETTKSKIKFDDVAGLEEEKSEMMEIVDFLKDPKKFYDMGAKIPRGVLLLSLIHI